MASFTDPGRFTAAVFIAVNGLVERVESRVPDPVLGEMKDYMIVVEMPLNDGRSVPVLAQVKQLAPGKPIRHVINSHSHFDHSVGSLRRGRTDSAEVVRTIRPIRPERGLDSRVHAPGRTFCMAMVRAARVTP